MSISTTMDGFNLIFIARKGDERILLPLFFSPWFRFFSQREKHPLPKVLSHMESLAGHGEGKGGNIWK
jgi:hypothetical protein